MSHKMSIESSILAQPRTVDSVAMETRADSARVEPGSETLDQVATKIALNQEQRITSVVVVPTVALIETATVDPDADPLRTQLRAMSIPELKTYIKDGIATGEQVLVEERRIADRKRRIKDEVICALRELKSRCKASKTWEKALKECGIAPSTWRSWDCRELNQLTTGKRTKSRKAEVKVQGTATSLAQAKAAVDADERVIDAGMCPVCSKPYLRLDEQWHAHVYVHKEHKEPGKRKPHLDDFCRTGAGDDNCPTCGEKYVNSWWDAAEHRHYFGHTDTTVGGDSSMYGDDCKGPVKGGRAKKADEPVTIKPVEKAAKPEGISTFQSPAKNNTWVAFKDGVHVEDKNEDKAVAKLMAKLERKQAHDAIYQGVNPAMAYVAEELAKRQPKLTSKERYALKKAKRLAEEKLVTDAKLAKQLARHMAIPVNEYQVTMAKQRIARFNQYRLIINEIQPDSDSYIPGELESMERVVLQPCPATLEDSVKDSSGWWLPVCSITDPEALHIIAIHMPEEPGEDYNDEEKFEPLPLIPTPWEEPSDAGADGYTKQDITDAINALRVLGEEFIAANQTFHFAESEDDDDILQDLPGAMAVIEWLAEKNT